MLAETVDEAFSDPRWIFELKYDGYRLLAAKEGGTVSLRYRSGIDATLGFPEIARALSALPFETFVLDGEVVVLDPDARPNFQRLQKRAMLLRSRDIERAAREHPVTLYAFDLLGFATYDVRGLPLLQRKELLRRMLPSTGPVRFADSIPEQGEMLMQEVTRLGIEGIVAKRADTPYVAGRTPHWRKIRVERTDDFVIVGFTEPENTRLGIGALQLATHVGETLTYVGKVGTGFSDRQLVELRAQLDGRVRAKPPCAGAVPKGARNVWVEPELVCEVRFKQLTDDLLLRQSVFLRMRDDKSPTECVLLGHDERPSESESESESKTDAAPTPTPSAAPTHHRRVVISNPDKVFWPAEGYTKLDLIEFYRDISPWLLPYLRDRPLVLTRYPDGIEGKNFFQKNAPPYLPPWVRTQTMWSEHAGREIEYFVCDDVDALTYVANLATIPLHVWGSRLTDLQHPDWCILDLDPKGAPFSDVVTIARHIHALCQEIDLPAYVKTSGSTGLHVLVPLGALCTFEQCRMLAEVLARVTASRLRDIATVERAMRARQGRVYIDYLQNGHGRLLVSPYCVRPLAGAPVSMPLAWDEVGPELDMGAFTIRTVPQIMQARGHDPMSPVLHEKPDLQHALAALLERLET
jgi:bifunctional non-homologous end joining protein LigD